MLDALDTIRMQRDAERVHALGPRATAELLAEIATRHDLVPDVLATLARYARLDTGMVHAVMQRHCGGRQFPPRVAVMEGAANG